jgi:predicted xylose isomerase-like sugar epimerase
MASFNKLTSDLAKAQKQMLAYEAGNAAKKIAYVVVNFDDWTHEYSDRYQVQIDQYVASNPVHELEIVFDIKPAFYASMS